MQRDTQGGALNFAGKLRPDSGVAVPGLIDRGLVRLLATVTLFTTPWSPPHGKNLTVMETTPATLTSDQSVPADTGSVSTTSPSAK